MVTACMFSSPDRFSALRFSKDNLNQRLLRPTCQVKASVNLLSCTMLLAQQPLKQSRTVSSGNLIAIHSTTLWKMLHSKLFFIKNCLLGVNVKSMTTFCKVFLFLLRWMHMRDPNSAMLWRKKASATANTSSDKEQQVKSFSWSAKALLLPQFCKKMVHNRRLWNTERDSTSGSAHY